MLLAGLAAFALDCGLQAVLQLLALLHKHLGAEVLAEIGGYSLINCQVWICGLGIAAGSSPAAVAGRFELPAESPHLHGFKPLAPALPQLLPLLRTDAVHGQFAPAAGQ